MAVNPQADIQFDLGGAAGQPVDQFGEGTLGDVDLHLVFDLLQHTAGSVEDILDIDRLRRQRGDCKKYKDQCNRDDFHFLPFGLEDGNPIYV
ncbi:MAG: hypothetical protein P9M08_03285 [Candidatus Erginobacter occultus]|nr:hypothetical protein [Candidatus Erginobacter occultus]